MPTHTIAKSTFKTKALAIFRHVEQTGEPVIVTDHGKPTIEIRRAPSEKVDALAALRGTALEYVSPTEPVGDTDWEAAR
jgi:antitoxin (DNA-binding transcriptional repressor) of toxin-antitoxin stability system